MRKDITITAEPRAERGKGAARRLRASGRIPAIVYGAGKDATAVSMKPKDLDRILHSSTGHNTIFKVEIGSQEESPAMIVDWQHDPVRDDLLHVDLERIDLSKKLKVKVPVHAEGEPKGVKTEGGLMEIVTREIEIECLPDDIPEHFVVDVQDLVIGQNVRASQVPISDKVELRSSPDTVICHVIALRTSEAEAEAEEEGVPAEEAAEPEVLKKGKPEEESKE